MKQNEMAGELALKIVETNLIGQEFAFDLVDTELHAIGFARGSMFDYDWAAYDYPLHSTKLAEAAYLRIFTRAVSGVIERSHCVVRITDVYMVGARYHEGLDFSLVLEQTWLMKARTVLEEVAKRLEFAEPLHIRMREALPTDYELRSGIRMKH